MDTSTPAGMKKRLDEFIKGYKESRNWRALTRLIGGSPRYDLQDLTDADHGEAPIGAEWK